MGARPILMLALVGAALAPCAARAAPTCDAFKAAMTRASGDLHADFARPLVVSRSGNSGLDAFDLVNNRKVDGQLHCRGDAFASFEARIAMPAEGPTMFAFGQVQRAALVAALGWPAARADRAVREWAVDAAEYLRASQERGDVSIAGKMEEHEPGLIDIGVIWTPRDRSFLILQDQ